MMIIKEQWVRLYRAPNTWNGEYSLITEYVDDEEKEHRDIRVVEPKEVYDRFIRKGVKRGEVRFDDGSLIEDFTMRKSEEFIDFTKIN